MMSANLTGVGHVTHFTGIHASLPDDVESLRRIIIEQRTLARLARCVDRESRDRAAALPDRFRTRLVMECADLNAQQLTRSTNEAAKVVPSQLLSRLNRFLDQRVAQQIMLLENIPRIDVAPPPPPPAAQNNPPPPNTRRHWPAGTFGNVMNNVQCVMLHETSGWPSFGSANNFQSIFSSVNLTCVWRLRFKQRSAADTTRSSAIAMNNL